MELKGKIHEIFPVHNVSDTFKKRDIVIEYAENPTYPEYIKFETHQDKVNVLDKYKKGDEVEVSFNLRGRPWTNKDGIISYFNSLVLWRINAVGADNGYVAPEYAPPADLSVEPGDEDDLPF